MGLNIKNPRVHELAREAARVTGSSQTGAIEEALVLLLEKYDADPAEAERERRVQRLLELGKQFRARHPELRGDESQRWQAELYDPETGLPR